MHIFRMYAYVGVSLFFMQYPKICIKICEWKHVYWETVGDGIYVVSVLMVDLLKLMKMLLQLCVQLVL